MDWVKVYSIVWLTITIIVPFALDGKKKEGRTDWYDGLVAVGALLPIYGRIFGYW